MGQIEEVVVVGGGPSGAFCALELARKGICATIFDPSHPREKPCGGGISPSAIEKFPFLEQYRSQGGTSAALKMISCTNNQVAEIEYRGFNLSRRFFDEEILNMAAGSGAKLVTEKVLGIRKEQDLWQIKTDKRQVTARILVGADGINSMVRQKTVGRIPGENLGLAYGHYATGVEDNPTTIKFVAEIPGYIWIFPRLNCSSIGIGSGSKHGSSLKRILDNFVRGCCPQIKIISNYAGMLPWATNPDFFALPCSGNNWVLVGDAAGHADPLTGEGIMYALWSGKLAAQAIAKNDLSLYDKLWREQYGNYLRERCIEKIRFYDPFLIEFSVAACSFQSKLNDSTLKRSSFF